MPEIFTLMIGIALAAACGFRVFVPVLGLHLAAANQLVDIGDGFVWLTTPEMGVILWVAVVAEIGAYYIPWVDNLLDSIATPMAVLAGTLLSASLFGDWSPALQWALALIAGGGAAATVQGSTVALRGASTLTTGGLGNPLLATAENSGAVGFTALALFAPLLAIVLLIAGLIWAWRRLRRTRTPALQDSI